MRTAILGGAGFIGANLVEYLIRQEKTQISVFDDLSMGNQLSRISDSNIRLIVGNMNSGDELGNFLENYRPDKIYHLVANSDISLAAKNPEVDIQKTFLPTLNLVNNLKKCKVKEIVFASSSAVYGEQDGFLKEDAPYQPISSYGWMKAMSEILLINAQSDKLFERLLIARFPNVTGRYQTHGVIFDLIHKAKSKSKVLNVLGNGYQTKPYLSATKLVEIIEGLLHLEWKDLLTINIAPTDRIQVREIVSMILEYAGISKNVSYQSSAGGWKGDVPSYMLDTSRLFSLLPELMLPSSKESIKMGIEYMWNLNES